MGFTGAGIPPDIDIQKIGDGLEVGYYTTVLCEGCGVFGILKNEQGGIDIIEESGETKPWKPEQERM